MPLTPETSNVVSSTIGGGASIIGSAIAGALNARENRKAFERQQQLMRDQYENYLHYTSRAGVTPAAVAQGLSHAGGMSAPGVSTSGNPYPDIGSSMASGISSGASQRQATSAATNADTERSLAIMKLQFEPQKYFADIQRALSETFMNTQHAFLYGSMKENYDELNKDLRLVRPWKIAGLKQGLLNAMATYENIIQDTKTKRSQESYNYSAADERMTQSRLNVANTEKTYQETYNLQLEQFVKQWQIDLLSNGIDPNKPFWENCARLAYSHPDLFKKRMDMFIQTLNIIDNRIQDNLGQHYKRNALVGYGLYKHFKGKSDFTKMLISRVAPMAASMLLAPATGGMSVIGAMPAFMSNSSLGY